MSESEVPQGAEKPEEKDLTSAAPLRFMGQYIKDLSFEVPNAPDIFNLLRQKAPEGAIIAIVTHEARQHHHSMAIAIGNTGKSLATHAQRNHIDNGAMYFSQCKPGTGRRNSRGSVRYIHFFTHAPLAS